MPRYQPTFTMPFEIERNGDSVRRGCEVMAKNAAAKKKRPAARKPAPRGATWGTRTLDEVVARAKEAMGRDMFGFEWNEYMHPLPFEVAKAGGFLNDDAKPDGWKTETPAEVSAQAKDYLSFWLEKIEGERGISVCRATMHFTAWKWLLGHPDADTFPGSTNAPNEGGWYQRRAYEHIKGQIDSGEWDRMSAAALEGSR
jgi:hypothetical protein